MIKLFEHKGFTGTACFVDEDFAPYLVKMGDKAVELGVLVSINSSTRKDTNVQNAIVEPAQMSNHLVGHAIDCNIIDGKIFWSSVMLKNPKGKVLELINYCKSIGLRWGGDFGHGDPKKVDSVHFDDRLNLKNPDLWREKYNRLHSLV